MPGKSWKVSELRVLTDAVRGAKSPSEISIPGRSAGAVRAMASRLHLIGDGISRKRWPDSDVQLLRQLVADGLTAKRIAETNALPGYGRNAIQKQMQRLGLGRPERSLPQKKARRLAGESIEAFIAFLSANAAAKTPAQLTFLWNQQHEPRVSHQRVLYHLGRLGLRSTTRSAMANRQATAAESTPGTTESPAAPATPAARRPGQSARTTQATYTRRQRKQSHPADPSATLNAATPLPDGGFTAADLLGSSGF
jgi:hypothetical protein